MIGPFERAQDAARLHDLGRRLREAAEPAIAASALGDGDFLAIAVDGVVRESERQLIHALLDAAIISLDSALSVGVGWYYDAGDQRLVVAPVPDHGA